jgi:hypothetical protein
VDQGTGSGHALKVDTGRFCKASALISGYPGPGPITHQSTSVVIILIIKLHGTSLEWLRLTGIAIRKEIQAFLELPLRYL